MSSTGAVWHRAKGITSGSLYGRLQGNGWNGEGKGRMANAPPPDAFQLTLIYRYSGRSDTLFHHDRSVRLTPEAAMTLVSQALLDTFTFSIQCSFLPGCPKTWLHFFISINDPISDVL